ncbi:type II toxin-antitoxin system MqsA family antitoxin [Thiohalocapsa sp. ML1]|jgi:HTH-type transcriptional regulator / antitoxin MqsA|uniref:type II toxin-antitoxin system MqsA family antitoxin n=1 Tax=Thiohalocapsa sp. ML1 TaxID=1431688 RepID=UPI000732366F|nr:type II toxin-antitoxin system MqsA family antitoxin [Thiohalocapsa sp. ML1]
MANNGDPCRICGEGRLTVEVEKNLVEYRGVSESLDSHYAVCDACGSEQADAAQARANKRLMVAFKKRVDGLLTGTEVRERRKRLNLTQEEAARVFGGGPVAFSKYEADDVAQSVAMDKLLRVASEVPGAGVWLIREAGLKPAVVPADWQNASDWGVEPERVPGEASRTLRIVSSSAVPTRMDQVYEAPNPGTASGEERAYG